MGQNRIEAEGPDPFCKKNEGYKMIGNVIWTLLCLFDLLDLFVSNKAWNNIILIDGKKFPWSHDKHNSVTQNCLQVLV